MRDKAEKYKIALYEMKRIWNRGIHQEGNTWNQMGHMDLFWDITVYLLNLQYATMEKTSKSNCFSESDFDSKKSFWLFASPEYLKTKSLSLLIILFHPN